MDRIPAKDLTVEEMARLLEAAAQGEDALEAEERRLLKARGEASPTAPSSEGRPED